MHAFIKRKCIIFKYIFKYYLIFKLICIYFVPGLRFATYQSKIGLIKILSNYKIDICDKTVIPYKYNPFSFISLPLGGIFLKITKLEN